MSLSKEQETKLAERMDWLHHDAGFDDAIQNMIQNDLALGDLIQRLPEKVARQIEAGIRNISYQVVEAALQRFESEKIIITGKGRYVEQCEKLVSDADAFFKNYDKEVKQIGLSTFRFAHRVMSDHLGEDKGFRTFAIKQDIIQHSLMRVFQEILRITEDAAAPIS